MTKVPFLLELLTYAVYVINAHIFSPLPYCDLFMLARSALSQPYFQHFNSMYADIIAKSGSYSKGQAKQAPPACAIISGVGTMGVPGAGTSL